MNARWPFVTPSGDEYKADAIHARATSDDEYALCERDGPLLPFGTVTMALDMARQDPSTVTRPVDCPECVSWMHA